MPSIAAALVLLATTGLLLCPDVSAFSAAATSATPSTNHQVQPVGGILILDHLNINHEKGRHDLLKAFYFDFLRCAVDPRKEENIAKGSKTLWANVGASQFHLPEGKPDAQVFDGLITLSYPNLDGLRERYTDKSIRSILDGTKFRVEDTGDDAMHITDPWGSQFKIIVGGEGEKDPRGVQKGASSEGLSMPNLTVYVPPGSNSPALVASTTLCWVHRLWIVTMRLVPSLLDPDRR